MPSKVVDVHRFTSSSYLSEEMLDPIEKQMGFWKVDCSAHPYGAKLVDTISQEKRAVGSKRSPINSLDFLKHVNQGAQGSSNAHIQTSSYISEGSRFNMNGPQYETGLFSSSLSDLFSRKLRFSSNNSVFSSVDIVGPPHMEEEPFESLKEIEAQTIGNLLPDDDDLLSETSPGVDFTVQSIRRDDIEDLDIFSSVGGMDLGDEKSSAGTNFSGGISSGHPVGYNGTVAGKQPDGEHEHASRTLFVRNINCSVEDSELQALFERYGDIQKLYTACKQRGFVMISYFDIRSASTARSELQNKLFKHWKLDIHFSIPKDNLLEEDIDLATLAVYNLDSSMSDDELHRTFSVYGDIKEIRGSLDKTHHKIVEFYDVRAAQAALHASDNIYIAGKLVRVEPSRLGFARQSTARREVEHDDILQLSGTPCSSTRLSSSMTSGNNTSLKPELRASISPFLENSYYHSVSSSVPNSLSSLGRAESVGSHSGFLEMGPFYEQLKFGYQGLPGSYPHSLPEHHNSFPGNSSRSMAANSGLSSGMHADLRSNRSSVNVNGGYPGNIISSISGHECTWNHGYQRQHPGMIWPRALSYGTDSSLSARPTQQLYGLPTSPVHMLNPVSPISDHHVGSAPTVNPSLWDRQHAFAGESAEASTFHPGSLGSLRTFKNSFHAMGFAHHNNFNHGDRNCMDPSIPLKNIELHSHNPRCLMFPGRGPSSLDSSNERVRGRKAESLSGHGDNKKQFELDLDRIMRGQDKRTTLMIKNIPNKYTSKMLLAAIDERHKGTYDFIYLPIDFKNKCNVGYAFINMTVPGFIIPFYQTFHGKKWEKFNSEKVASLAYARIQGKAALIAHFQNSSLMNEDKRCRPILFNTDGPNAGDQVPFPVGINIRSRPGKARTSGNDDQESPRSLKNGDGFSGSDSSSVSAKDLD